MIILTESIKRTLERIGQTIENDLNIGKSIIENIFFAILWIVCTISNFLYLITLESSNNKDI